MTNNLSLISGLLLMGSFQGFILTGILFSIKRNNALPNRILAGVIFIFSISIFIFAFSFSYPDYTIPFPKGHIMLFLMALAPLIFLYTSALTKPEFNLSIKTFWHFTALLPSIVIVYAQPPQSDKINLSGEGESIQLMVLGFLVVILTFLYLGLALKRIKEYNAEIKDTFSAIDKIKLRWLQFLIIAFFITQLIAIFSEGGGGGAASWNYYWIVVSVFMYSIGYMGLRQPEIFSGEIKENIAKHTKKYEKSTLDESQAKTYFQKLQTFMVEKKPYLNSYITLPELAGQLSIPVHHLSQIINQKQKQNFFEYINSARIEEAKKMLNEKSNDHLSIAAIGFEAGFNSVSAFNGAFKKHTGVTPSNFRDKA